MSEIQNQSYVSSFFILISVFLFILIISAIIRKLKHRRKKRRYFLADIKKQVLIDQNYKCSICNKNIRIWDYDHIDGNRSNNDISNCQALCPNCHAKKTRGLIKLKKQSSKTSKLKTIIVAIAIILIIFAILANLW